MQIELIHTGFFYADGGAMFGAVPKKVWSRHYPSNKQNSCILSMTTLLIRTGERVILVDTGAGNKHLKQLSYYRFFNLTDLHYELFKRNIMPEQVSDVILTHLHFDHCGYLTLHKQECEQLDVAFPNARHWISEQQWENFLSPNPLEKDSFFDENILPVKAKGLLHLVKHNCTLCEGVSLKLYNGHTLGQIVPYIGTKERTFVFAGDVIPLAASVSPKWISAYDNYPVTSYHEKILLLTEAEKEHQAVIYCHDAYTKCTTIKKVRDSYKSGLEVQI
ncbi:MAG: MBL fold metallo-hydrolase [Bacteroidales bacterium]|jgi:glyoxylase-like metal-dependent hydrolase (beta-lactamase superfamily II)|nr:MBL fold metallo-hydrolase [Bacteroidales bacterium]